MRAGIVRQIAGKEIVSTIRDRRAIVSNLVVPLVLLPTIMLGLPLAFGGLFTREQATQTPVAVQNLDELPPALSELLLSANVAPQASDDAEAAVTSDSVSLGLLVPLAMSDSVAAGERAELMLFTKRGNLRAEVTASKVTGAIEAYRQGLVSERLRDAGLDPAVLEPITVSSVDASSAAERSSGQLSWIIPFFIAIWTLVGGQMTAIDATAGEKERGTLEALLVAPVRRSEVVAGKFLATLLFGLAAAVMAIVGYIAGGAIVRWLVRSRLSGEAGDMLAELGGSLQITPSSVALLLVSTLLLAATMAAVLLCLTMFARSFKEAQSYVAPLSFLLIVPVVALQFNDLLDLGPAVYLVPVVNVLLLMDGIVTGAFDWAAILLTFASLAVVVALLLAFAHRNFSRESVIFRT
ncbi:MAG: ABC transporter permease subunit [Trueperaceae bacterium]